MIAWAKRFFFYQQTGTDNKAMVTYRELTVFEQAEVK